MKWRNVPTATFVKPGKSTKVKLTTVKNDKPLDISENMKQEIHENANKNVRTASVRTQQAFSLRSMKGTCLTASIKRKDKT